MDFRLAIFTAAPTMPERCDNTAPESSELRRGFGEAGDENEMRIRHMHTECFMDASLALARI